MSSDIILAGNVAYLKGAQASVIINGLNRPINGKTDGAKIKDVKPEQFPEVRPWAMWGDDDQFPETVREDVKYSIMLSRGLQSQAKMLYANGIMTYKTEVDAEGKETVMPVADKNFKDFSQATHLDHYLAKASYQHGFYNNIFPRLIFSADKKKVNKIICEKSRYGRWEKINAATGKIDNCYISAWFNQYPQPNDKTRVKLLPAINLFDDLDAIRNNDTQFEYVYRSMYPLSNEDYYAVPAWNSARENGWVEVEKRIPELKKYMFTNQINIKYHIQIPYDHWELKYGKAEWAKFDEDQKKKKIEEQLKEINDFLTGSENAYKAFVSHFSVDPIRGVAMPGWKLERLDTGGQKSEYLEDVDQANYQISIALGWDLTMSGSAAKGMGAGSGSDKREAWLIATSMLRLDSDFILAPLYFIRDYNGWDPDLQFGFRQVVLTTLDKNPTGSQKVISN